MKLSMWYRGSQMKNTCANFPTLISIDQVIRLAGQTFSFPPERSGQAEGNEQFHFNRLYNLQFILLEHLWKLLRKRTKDCLKPDAKWLNVMWPLIQINMKLLFLHYLGSDQRLLPKDHTNCEFAYVSSTSWNFRNYLCSIGCVMLRELSAFLS